MACCCGKKEMKPPKVALLGATGVVGQFVTSAFLQSLANGSVVEVRVLTTKESELTQLYTDHGAIVSSVNYSEIDTVVQALTGVDAVVSTCGVGDGICEMRTSLLDALEKAGVKIYFPSEFGVNHYTKAKTYSHSVFEGKQEHFQMAKQKGIKCYAFMCGFIMEMAFCSYFGCDNKEGVWTIVGKGETPEAVTSGMDMGRYTVEAVIRAFNSPKSVPEFIEIYGDLKTHIEYADILDNAAGSKSTFNMVDMDEAAKKYDETKDFMLCLQILREAGACDFTGTKANDLLNPKEEVWKVKKVEDFAKECGGRPSEELVDTAKNLLENMAVEPKAPEGEAAAT